MRIALWLILLTIVAITGFALLAGGLIASNMALHRLAQGIWLDIRRRHDRIDDDLAEIKRLLRER